MQLFDAHNHLQDERFVGRQEHLIGEAMAQGYKRFEWMHRRADGSDFPVMVTLILSKV